jgi:S-DNA-T family DNA segregation ATPase FtsK/SpoIIIE
VTGLQIRASDRDEGVIEGRIVGSGSGALGAVRSAVTHPRMKSIAKNTVYIGVGTSAVCRRAWDSRTTAFYDRQIRACEAAGDREGSLEWEERRARYVRERHARRMDYIELPGKIMVRLPWVLGGTGGFLAAIGVCLAVSRHDPGDVVLPFEVLAAVIGTAVFIASVAWGWILSAAAAAALAALWYTGKSAVSAGSGPGWVRTADDADLDVAIDETTIAAALDALRVPQIRDYLKAGHRLQYLTPCRVDGRGTYCKIRLPKGVTAEKIARRREDLATGLYRLAKEVWPATGEEAGILDLWIADKGALNAGAGPWPLLSDGLTDVFKGIPLGRTLKGDPVYIPLMGRNTIVGGMPDQGKSSVARIIMAGAALDPTAELRILIPDSNFDFKAFEPRCSKYVMGADDDSIRAIRDQLLWLHAEIQDRGDLLVEYGEPEVTRELASAGVGLHPLFVLVEEAHVAIQHTEHGKEIGKLLGDIVKLCRKRGIHVAVSTQAPIRGSMPADVTRNCTNGIAFAVSDHWANDALLGAGAHAAGHRATDLIPGTDKGTALVKGFTGQRSELVQAHFLSVRAENDQVTPLINRVLAELERQGREVPGGDGTAMPEQRDLLDDLDEVLGTDRVKLRDCVSLLRGLAPFWGEYRRMTATQLKGLLETEGVKPVNTSGTFYLDPGDLHAVLAGKSTADLDEPPW